eukprot:gene9153-14196_t
MFAAARELSGVSETTMKVPSSCDTEALLAMVVKQYPKLSSLVEQLPTVLAVNKNMMPLGEKVVLKEGDEIAVIPPISGG